MRIIVGVADLVQRTGDGRTGRVQGDRTIGRSGDAMCGLHRARGDEEHEFLGSASKPRLTVCQWFDLKTTRTIFSGLASKPVVTVFSGLASKSVATIFSDFASKPVVGSLVEPQNHGLWFVSSLASKPLGRFVSGLASKPLGRFLPV
jgi:hypothetical protein